MPLIYSSATPLLLLATFLASSQFILEGHAKTSKKTWSNGQFASSCAFDLGGYSYNLCPLTGGVIHGLDTGFVSGFDTRQERRTSGRPAMMVDPVNNRGAEQRVDNEQSSPDHEILRCDNGNGDCLMEESIPFFWRKTILERTSEVTLGFGREEDVHPCLHLLSKNMRGALRTDITLSCSSTTELKSAGQIRGTTYWQLSSPYACPRSFAAFSGKTKDKGKKEKEGDDDLMPKRGASTLRKLTIAAIFILGLPLLFGGILLSSRRARKFSINHLNNMAAALLPFVSKAAVTLRPITTKISTLNSKLTSPFRPGSKNLVVWAQEDMTLADAEDIMVNGSGALDEDGWHADGLEEYIPLSSNSRHGAYGHFRSYGTTGVVETFADAPPRREWSLNGLRRFFHR